jgi:ABC-type antimicrobial peptide transport system permease subunit
MAFHVTRRTAELGIRAALGAQRQQLLALVLKDVLWLTLLGCIVGLAASLWTGKLVANLLFATSPADPLLLGLAALTLSCTSVLAGFEPARRAAKMDPMNTLRSE